MPNKLAHYFKRVRNWPVHPQWLIFKDLDNELTQIAKQCRGLTVDIGCADQQIREKLGSAHNYIGLDYYETVSKMYGTRPTVFGDAQNLPFADTCIDTVLLMDVLEHLPDPDACLREIQRILTADGLLIMQVPFVYPIHDAPYDFQRWTLHGLRLLVAKHGFSIEAEHINGEPIVTATVLQNIALSKTLINLLSAKSILALPMAIIVPPVILLNNLLARFIAVASTSDPMMPHGYRLILGRCK